MTQRSSATRLLLVAAVVGLTASAAHATTLIERTVAQQIDRADLVFVGTVVDTEAVPTGDRAFAFTFVTFEVEETLKGSVADPLLNLRFAGGAWQEDVFEVHGIPRFAPGERHLLFVAGNGRLGCPLVGWMQGKLDFAAHPLTGEPILIDFRGQAVGGIEDGRWLASGPALTAERTLRPQREPGVTVLSEEGVEITVEPSATTPESARAAAVSPSLVLDQLRSAIRSRSGAPTFRTAPPVDSASPADVPETFRFQAYPAPAR